MYAITRDPKSTFGNGPYFSTSLDAAANSTAVSTRIILGNHHEIQKLFQRQHPRKTNKNPPSPPQTKSRLQFQNQLLHSWHKKL